MNADGFEKQIKCDNQSHSWSMGSNSSYEMVVENIEEQVAVRTSEQYQNVSSGVSRRSRVKKISEEIEKRN